MPLSRTALSHTARWLVLLVLACGAPPAPAAAPEPPAPEAASGDTYPTPYTAEQIRDATRPGRAYTWRVEESGKTAIERTIAFTVVDAEGAEITRDGVAKRVTWEELRRHAE